MGYEVGRALGCVNPASRLPLAAEHEFTQPRAYLIAQLSSVRVYPLPRQLAKQKLANKGIEG